MVKAQNLLSLGVLDFDIFDGFIKSSWINHGVAWFFTWVVASLILHLEQKNKPQIKEALHGQPW